MLKDASYIQILIITQPIITYAEENGDNLTLWFFIKFTTFIYQLLNHFWIQNLPPIRFDYLCISIDYLTCTNKRPQPVCNPHSLFNLSKHTLLSNVIAQDSKNRVNESIFPTEFSRPDDQLYLYQRCIHQFH